MRYDVEIKTTVVHIFAVEADDALTAQEEAFQLASVSMPSKVDTHIEIEVGNG